MRSVLLKLLLVFLSTSIKCSEISTGQVNVDKQECQQLSSDKKSKVEKISKAFIENAALLLNVPNLIGEKSAKALMKTEHGKMILARMFALTDNLINKINDSKFKELLEKHLSNHYSDKMLGTLFIIVTKMAKLNLGSKLFSQFIFSTLSAFFKEAYELNKLVEAIKKENFNIECSGDETSILMIQSKL